MLGRTNGKYQNSLCYSQLVVIKQGNVLKCKKGKEFPAVSVYKFRYWYYFESSGIIIIILLPQVKIEKLCCPYRVI